MFQYSMCDMRVRGVANDRGKGPEIGNEGDVHCLQNGLNSSQAKCLVLKVKLSVWSLF